MNKLVNNVLKLNEKLLECDINMRDSIICKIERLLEKATLKDIKAIYNEESHIAEYEWRHQEYADYYMNMIRNIELDKELSVEDL